MKQIIQLELVEAAREGDRAAIEALLLQCQPSVTQFARKYCSTPEDVEDAVQLTLWHIHRKIKGLKSSKAFISWIFKIVKNQCHRLFGTQRFDSQELSDFEQLLSSNDTEALALLQTELVTAIAHLPSSHRQILIMRDVEGFTGAEVAQELGLSLETVKSRLHTARHILREKLQHWID